MKSCGEELIGFSVFVIILGFLAAPFVIAAATAALPFVMIGGLVWLLVRVLRSQWLSDNIAAQTRKAQAPKNPAPARAYTPTASPYVAPSIPPRVHSPSPPTSMPPKGVVGHASGRPFRVYEASDSRLQRTFLYAEEYDDGRVRGFAVYGHRAAGVTILPRAEFDARYKRWIE